MLLLNRICFKRCIILILVVFFETYSFSQTKKLTPQIIQEFVELIEQNAMPVGEHLESSKDFSTFVKTLKLTSTFDILNEKELFTVFAPTNAAFQQFPVEVINELFLPNNLEKLKSITTYHIVRGKLSIADIIRAIDENDGGEIKLQAINGLELKAFYDEGSIYVKDDNGYSIKVQQLNGIVSNGLFFKIDTVILPQVDNENERQR